MAALTSENPRKITTSKILKYPVFNNTTIYRGSVVGQESVTGNVRALVAGDIFVGIAVTSVTGGNIEVEIDESYLLEVAGVLPTTALSTAVYASSDNDFTLTVGTNTRIGQVVKIDGVNAIVDTSK